MWSSEFIDSFVRHIRISIDRAVDLRVPVQTLSNSLGMWPRLAIGTTASVFTCQMQFYWFDYSSQWLFRELSERWCQPRVSCCLQCRLFFAIQQSNNKVHSQWLVSTSTTKLWADWLSVTDSNWISTIFESERMPKSTARQSMRIYVCQRLRPNTKIFKLLGLQ